jgi:aflatoxin B1 aldehyde reductase
MGLFPLLRQLGLTFNAYSALAGGFLVKSPAEFANGVGRWDTSTPHGKLFHDLYDRPKLLAAMETWDAISKESGIAKADLSYRWVAWHSRLGEGGQRDGIVLGASGPGQLRKTLQGLEAGSLPREVVERIEGVWQAVKEEAILDNYNWRNF